MQFTKDITFIGCKDMILKDGAVLYTVTFYVDGSAVEVNVPASNLEVVPVLKGLSFGASCSATFTLRKSDKLYRLSLTRLADV